MSEQLPMTAASGALLIGVALMFFAPLGLSFYLYYGKSWHPGGRVNAGQLIEPARPLPMLALPLLSTGETDPRNSSKVSGLFCMCSTAAAMMNAAGICMTRARFAWRWIGK